VAGGPVRLVKTIGDAAMLVSPEPAALVDAALALVDAAEAEGEDFPQLHAGVALGPVVSRGGDWYGHTVNLASRIAAIAYPTSVLCEDAVHDAAPEAFRWSFAGERRLKGVKRPVRLWRARRRASDDEKTAT
jgi:adenylate cyclase